MHGHANEATIMARAPSPGFTLLELMIAVAILALLAALAAPSLADFFDRNRVRAAADDVSSLISRARAESVKHDLPVSIRAVGSSGAWCIGANEAALPTGGAKADDNATACDCTQTTQCMVSGIRQVVSSDEYHGVSMGTLPGNIRLDNKLGAIMSANGTLGTQSVTLTSPTGKYDVVVQVQTLGQARLCTPSGKPTLSGMAQC
ncbi:GspH/FimT family pseudopilin [Noviluteimonas gilva]|uniref:Type II secretion system protein H n=1 Tax=Noviluteimonas gilva TaxID=2682097 RepID=A0A7C9LIH7_9GAMM|nr:GspH/FimT family pseudopilin [Lysobacter gilvus]MUV15721.1 prepilin-type N-terminal cleavage/methylation domain-containing protein [Lysobacter gilvus]